MRLFIAVALLLVSVQGHGANLVVVTNAGIDQPLTKAQVRNTFLGTPLAGGIKPVEIEQGHPLRRKFNAIVIGMTESRISAYWAQMRFSGTRRKPVQLADENAILDYLRDNQGVVAYLPADTVLPEGVSVVLEL